MKPYTHIQGNIRVGVRRILEGLGVSVDDPNFKGTPDRVARAYMELCAGLWEDGEIEELFTATFPSTYDQMIIAKDINAVGVCPHHLLPVEYIIHICYMPNSATGTVLGVSKLSRLAKLLAKRPVLQEQLTEDIANRLTSGLSPEGIGVIVIGKHSCMRLRGVRDDGVSIVTSIMLGAIRDDPATRAEFIELIKLGRE